MQAKTCIRDNKLYTMTEVLSGKVDKEKLKQLEEIALDEQADRSTGARRLLDMGMKEWKVNKAVEMFRRGKPSLRRGAPRRRYH